MIVPSENTQAFTRIDVPQLGKVSVPELARIGNSATYSAGGIVAPADNEVTRNLEAAD